MKRKICILALVIAIISCFSIGAVSAFAATEEPVLTLNNENCKVVGASIRFADEKSNTNDIRFEFQIDNDVYSTLVNPVVSLNVKPEKLDVKNFVVPKKNILTKTVNDVSVVYGRAYIYNVPAEEYIHDFVVNVNVVDDNGVNFTSTSVSKSVSYVAYAALGDTSKTYTEEQKTALNSLLPDSSKLSITENKTIFGYVNDEIPYVPYGFEVFYNGELVWNKDATIHKAEIRALSCKSADGKVEEIVNNKFTPVADGVYEVEMSAKLYGTEKKFSVPLKVGGAYTAYDLFSVATGLTKTLVNDPSINPNVEIVKYKSLGNSEWTSLWGVENVLTERLNANEDNALVFNCYNTSDAPVRVLLNAQDVANGDIAPTYGSGYYNTRVVAEAHQYFQLVVPKDVFKGLVNYLGFSIYYCKEQPGLEFAIVDAKIIDKNTVATQVWDDNAVPTNFRQFNDSSDAETSDLIIKQNPDGAGLLLDNTNGAGYRSIVLYDEPSSILWNKFARAEGYRKNSVFISFDVENLNSSKGEFWCYYGDNCHNWPEYHWMYYQYPEANQKMTVYYNTSYFQPGFNFANDLGYLRFDVANGSKLLITNMQVLEFDKIDDYAEIPFSSNDFIQSGSYALPTMTDSVVNGKNTVTFSNFDFSKGDFPGARLNPDSAVFRTFRSLNKDEGMKITITNVDSTKDVWPLFYITKDSNDNSQRPLLHPGESAVMYFKNDGAYREGITYLEFWLTGKGTYDGAFSLIFDFVKDSDYEVSMLDLNAETGADIADKMMKSRTTELPQSVTYIPETNQLEVVATVDSYIDLLNLGDYSLKLKEFYANATKEQRRTQVLALDVEYVTSAELVPAVWLGVGAVNGNNLANNREQIIYLNGVGLKRTVYITIGMLGYADQWQGVGQDVDKFGYVQFNVKNETVRFSNLRVLNFAGIK